MKKLLFFLFLFLHPFFLFAQSNLAVKQEIINQKNVIHPQKPVDIIINKENRLKAFIEKCNAARSNKDKAPNTFINMMSQLANIFLNEGRIIEGKKLIDETLPEYFKFESKINNKKKHDFLFMASSIEDAMNNTQKSLKYMLMDKELYEKENDFSDNYICCLYSTAATLLDAGKNEEALPYIKQSIEYYERLYGENSVLTDHSFNVDILYCWARYLQRSKDYEMAKRLYSLVKELYENNAWKKESYFRTLNNLGVIYTNEGNMTKSLQVYEKLLQEQGFLDRESMQNILFDYIGVGDEHNSSKYLEECENDVSEILMGNYANLAEPSREAICERQAYMAYFFNALYGMKFHSKEAVSNSLDYELFLKAFPMKFLSLLTKLYEKEDLEQARRKYENLRESLIFKSNELNVEEFDSIQSQVMNAEKDLLSKIPTIPKKAISCSWKDIALRLNKNEAAVEFCYFCDTLQNFYYGAYIIEKGKNPWTIKLASLKSVNELIGSLDNVEKNAINYSNVIYSDSVSNAIYNFFWKDIIKKIGKDKKIYYSPIGRLCLINSNALYDTKRTLAGDNINFVRVSTLSAICNNDIKKDFPYKSAVLYGNIKYDSTNEEMEKAACKYFNNNISSDKNIWSLRGTDNERGNWMPIEATKSELSNISNTLKDNGINVTTYEQEQANEESFKAFSGNSPDIIHIATHGFYVGNSKQAKNNEFLKQLRRYSDKEQYMLISGLLMSGANNTWNGNKISKNVEDGILTSEEISRLNLSNTKMVVLSACETANGHLTMFDGIFGLQLAFKIAGAGSIVMSLWKISDTATSVFMDLFYKNLVLEKNRHIAFRKTIKTMRKRYPDPYYWAGFIMLD